ncbi:MAG TPA: pyridoxal-phosphate dependent enzyme, partial [Spirochaetia bacterium]|nr:pyridoxal-phosphate dependent enzyme [Spirochaetia bacterium]
QYGADLRSVEGTYDEAYERSLEYTAAGKAMSRNTGYNPLTIEGKKTVSFEIVDQLGAVSRGQDGTAHSGPDHVFVPVGDGVILAGVYRGFENLLRLGRIARMPTVWACQAEGSSAIVRALRSGGFTSPQRSQTVADSISVDVPRNGVHALSKLIAHEGRGVTVSDEEILLAQHHLSSRTGLFAEPSSSAAFASFLKMRGEINPESRVVLLITGSGLKDIEAAAHGLKERQHD